MSPVRNFAKLFCDLLNIKGLYLPEDVASFVDSITRTRATIPIACRIPVQEHGGGPSLHTNLASRGAPSVEYGVL